jgi:hypothetical protein
MPFFPCFFYLVWIINIGNMNCIRAFIIPIFFIVLGCTHDRYTINYQSIDPEQLLFYPEFSSERPGLPSPAKDRRGREVVLATLQDSLYTWFDATVENGDAFDYKKSLLGKGNQLLADETDFPTFAKRGIHSDRELASTKIITGRSVSQITVDGRPGRSSGAGFMAANETILSVVWQDNQTVKKMGLTHPDLARPLFQLWNSTNTHTRANESKPAKERTDFTGLVYNGYEIAVQVTGSRGWQESIFNDEILGTGHIEIRRELDDEELEFLKGLYKHLTPEQFEVMKEKLIHLHTGEMVLFYINRYGFYEGHTDFRADPVTIAFVFGLKSIEELHKAANENLYQYFTSHFTNNPE